MDKNTPDLFDSIYEFNRDVTQAVRLVPMPLMAHEASFLINAVREEIHIEFKEAVIDGDIVKQIDALIDAMYYIVGGLYRIGLTPKTARDCFEAVHACNMRKANGIRDRRETEVESDAIKPDDWVGPEDLIINILKGD